MIGALFALALAQEPVGCAVFDVPVGSEQAVTLVGDVGMDMRHALLWIEAFGCGDRIVLLLLNDVEGASADAESRQFLDQLHRVELSLLEQGRLGSTAAPLHVQATGHVVDARPGRALRVSDIKITGTGE